MKKLFYSAFAYMVIGVLSGVFYREYTKGTSFTGYTQLSIVHTHLLTLGFIVLLIVLILEKLFTLSASRLFNWFFWTYNAGLVITAAIMVWHGILQVNGTTEVSGAIPGIAGVGHILLSAGMVLLFLALRTRLFGAGARNDAKNDAESPAVLAG
jgi:hypothetical protein